MELSGRLVGINNHGLRVVLHVLISKIGNSGSLSDIKMNERINLEVLILFNKLFVNRT
jgi:hypothetical protein